jgi:hypothetical protein
LLLLLRVLSVRWCFCKIIPPFQGHTPGGCSTMDGCIHGKALLQLEATSSACGGC